MLDTDIEIYSISEKELFSVALCVHAIWFDEPSVLDATIPNVFERGWLQGYSIVAKTSMQLLTYIDENFSPTSSRQEIVGLLDEVNSGVPDVWQLSAGAITDALVSVLKGEATNFSDLDAMTASEKAEHFVLILVLFAGLVRCCARRLDADPYSVMFRTLYWRQ